MSAAGGAPRPAVSAAGGAPRPACELRLVLCPFDSACYGTGMGAGPRALADDPRLAAALGGAGFRLTIAEVPAPEDSHPEILRTFEQHGWVADLVRGAREDGAFPLVLAGNCGSSVGTAAGLGTADLGVVWLDAHADLDTPEDNVSGFLDVMALSTLTGAAWRAQAGSVPGFAPIPPQHVVLAAVRDLAPYQRAALERSAVKAVPGAYERASLVAALETLPTPRVLLHLDLDALDGAQARANAYAAPGGPSLDTLLETVDAVFDRFDVAAAALTAYEPAADDTGAAADAALALLHRVAVRARAARAQAA
jgi:arginase